MCRLQGVPRNPVTQGESRNQDAFLNAFVFKVWPLDQKHQDTLRLVENAESQALLHRTYWIGIHS